MRREDGEEVPPAGSDSVSGAGTSQDAADNWCPGRIGRRAPSPLPEGVSGIPTTPSGAPSPSLFALLAGGASPSPSPPGQGRTLPCCWCAQDRGLPSMGLGPSSCSRPRKAAPLEELPEALLLEVLALVPRRDLVLRCRLVCSRWRDLVDLPVLWRLKCRRYGLGPPKDEGGSQDWRAFYFHLSEGNLVKNPCGEDGLNFWNFSALHWNTARLIRFQEDGKNLPRAFPDAQKCFLLASRPALHPQVSTKSQRINLREDGYSDQLMDKTRPAIVVKDWFYNPGSAHCQLRVRLLSGDGEILKESWLATTNPEWNEVSHTFDDYPPGVCYIDLEHKLQHGFGGKVTNTTVLIDPEANVGLARP